MTIEVCKNCQMAIHEVIVPESDFAAHKEWRHVDTNSEYCDNAPMAVPKR